MMTKNRWLPALLILLLVVVIVLVVGVPAVRQAQQAKQTGPSQQEGQRVIVITGMKPGTNLSVDLTPGKEPKVYSDTDTVRYEVREVPKEKANEAVPKSDAKPKPKADAEASP